MPGIDLKRFTTVAELGYPDSSHDRFGDHQGTLYWIDSNQVQNKLFPPAAASFSNFIVSDGGNTQQIDDGNTLTFTGSTAIDGTVSATDTLTLNWDLTKLTSAGGTLTDSDYLGIFDLSGNAHQRLALGNLPTISSLDSTNDKFTVIDATDSRLKLVAADNFPGGSTVSTHVQNLGDITPTSTTSTTGADVTNSSFNYTVVNGDLTVAYYNLRPQGGTGASFIAARIVVGSTNGNWINLQSGTTAIDSVVVIDKFTGISAGSQAIKLQIKSSSGASVTIDSNGGVADVMASVEDV